MPTAPDHPASPTLPRVTLTREPGLAVLRLCHPPVNALTVGMASELGSHLIDLEDDCDVGVVIVTGDGARAFSAGSDIREFSRMLDPGQAVQRKLKPQNDMFSYLAHYPKPTIAALNGVTLGGGLEVAVCCDLIIADRGVAIGSPEITLGLFPSSGGTFRVARRLGPGRTKELQLLGVPISAERAYEWGLVNRLAEPGECLSVARTLAATLLQRPPLALSLCKSIIDASSELNERETIARSLQASERAFTSAECAEGVAAFLGRRPPVYRY